MLWGDVWGIVRAVVGLAAVLWAPGYCLGWMGDVLAFRALRGWGRAALAVALSFMVVPITLVLVAKAGGFRLEPGLGAAAGVAAAGLVLRERRGRRLAGDELRARGETTALSRWAYGLAAAWVGFVILELVDVGVGDRLYLSVTVFDHALRTAFVDAVMRTGVPPANPLFWAGHAAPMRYYYFWYVPVAVAARLVGATARQGLIASVAWAGFGLAAAISLFCRDFLGLHGRRAGAGIGLALLGVTGLDVVPALAKGLVGAKMDADMDWWSPDQVTSWLGSVLWAPHHVAGLVCCVAGFLLVWRSQGRSGRERVWCGGLAGMGFASAFGCSTWVAVAFAAVLAVWAVWASGRARTSGWKQTRARVPVLAAASLLAVVLLVPYLVDLRNEASSVEASGAPVQAGGAGRLLRPGVRHMIDPEPLRAVPGLRRLAASHPAVEDALAGLILLVPGYVLELGFFGGVLVLGVRRWPSLDEAGRAAVVLAVAGLGVASCVRSTVVVNNDFGIRSMLVAQFFLLLLGVVWWEGGLGADSVRTRRAMFGLLAAGVAGTAYQAMELRVYLPVQERLGRAEQAGLAERAMAVRRAFAAMDARLPPGAVIQFRPTAEEPYLGYAKVMFASRQMAEGLPECGAAFGGEVAACAGVQASVQAIFAGGMQAEEARRACGMLHIDTLAATRWDGVWNERKGWVWALPAVVDTGSVRVLDCRPGAAAGNAAMMREDVDGAGSAVAGSAVAGTAATGPKTGAGPKDAAVSPALPAGRRSRAAPTPAAGHGR